MGIPGGHDYNVHNITRESEKPSVTRVTIQLFQSIYLRQGVHRLQYSALCRKRLSRRGLQVRYYDLKP